MRKLIVLVLLLIALVGCGSTDTASTQATQAPTATQPAKPITWSDGAIKVFHGDNGNYQGVGGYTDSFTVPGLWRLKWFCQASSDPTQGFFGIDVQHAGDVSNADGETPLQVDCNQQPHGFTEEHVGGSVTLQILAGTGTSWDVYVQTPQ